MMAYTSAGLAPDVLDQMTLPSVSIVVIAIALVTLLPLMVFSGHYVGTLQAGKAKLSGKTVDEAAGETSFGVMMAVLGLLLAFTFGHALSTENTRKDTAYAEAAALGTAFLRADFLPEEMREKLKRAVFDYAETRIIPAGPRLYSQAEIEDFLTRSMTAQAKLWPLAKQLKDDSSISDPVKLFVAGAINDVLDAHLDRLKTLSSPVSELSQFVLAIAALASMFMLGNRSGLKNRPLTWRPYALAMFLALIMYAIVDTQRGEEGVVRTDQSALVLTLIEMEHGL